MYRYATLIYMLTIPLKIAFELYEHIQNNVVNTKNENTHFCTNHYLMYYGSNYKYLLGLDIF